MKRQVLVTITASLCFVISHTRTSKAEEYPCDPHCTASRFAPAVPKDIGIRRVTTTRITAGDPYLEYGSTVVSVILSPTAGEFTGERFLEFGVTKNSTDNTLKAFSVCGGCYPQNSLLDWNFITDLPNGGSGGRFSLQYSPNDLSWNWFFNGEPVDKEFIGVIGNDYLPSALRLLWVAGEISGSDNNELGVGLIADLKYQMTPCPPSGTGPCVLNFIPDNTVLTLLGGPPPTPRKYWSKYQLGSVKFFTECHLSGTCSSGR